VERGVEENGGDEERQRKARLNRECRRAGHKGKGRAAKGEKHWIGNANPARQSRQDHGGEQQTKQRDEFGHLIFVRRWRPAYTPKCRDAMPLSRSKNLLSLI